MSALPGARSIRLFRDVRKPGRFVSVGEWDDANAVRAFKSAPEFKEGLGRLVRLAAEFGPTEHVTLAKATGGSTETHSPPEDSRRSTLRPSPCLQAVETGISVRHRLAGGVMDSDKVKGKLKETEGKVTGDEEREAQGKNQQDWGKVKEKAREAKDKVS